LVKDRDHLVEALHGVTNDLSMMAQELAGFTSKSD
jgi:hypothetical protein